MDFLIVPNVTNVNSQKIWGLFGPMPKNIARASAKLNKIESIVQISKLQESNVSETKNLILL